MAICAYYTIDDSPSEKTTEMVDHLLSKDIPALLFARGDRLEENPAPIIDAIQKGFVIGNHNYSHTRASEMSYTECTAEIEKTEKLIDQAYAKAGITRQGKYFRFPHMDRGCGGWVINYDEAGSHKDKVMSVLAAGLNVSLNPPSEPDKDKKWALQNYLRREGFTTPFRDVEFHWYADTEMAQAADCMFTFSNNDWMLTQRHLEKDWAYKTLDDLKSRIDDEMLSDTSNTHVVLGHDQSEISHISLALIDYMTHKGVQFLPIK